MIPAHELERMARLARKARAFLADDDIKSLFAGLDRDAFERFRSARTGRERLEAWAFSRALDEVKAALQGAVESGDHAESVNPDLR